jgi:nucleoid-associated protein YgaU
MHRIVTLLCSTLLLASGFASAQEAAATAEAAVPAPPAETAAVAAAPAAPEIDRSTLKYSNKWRIKFSGEAKSDGVLVFRMIMKDAEPVVVSIDIKDGTNDDNIADKVEKAMKNAFPRDFNVEVDDGESVLVKLNIVEGSSSIELLENTVAKVKVRIKKE